MMDDRAAIKLPDATGRASDLKGAGGSDTVHYRGEHLHPGGLARYFDITDQLDRLARITAHIPRKGARQVVYYGACSQAWRGRERRQGILPKASADENFVSVVTFIDR